MDVVMGYASIDVDSGEHAAVMYAAVVDAFADRERHGGCALRVRGPRRSAVAADVRGDGVPSLDRCVPTDGIELGGAKSCRSAVLDVEGDVEPALT